MTSGLSCLCAGWLSGELSHSLDTIENRDGKRQDAHGRCVLQGEITSVTPAACQPAVSSETPGGESHRDE